MAWGEREVRDSIWLVSSLRPCHVFRLLYRVRSFGDVIDGMGELMDTRRGFPSNMAPCSRLHRSLHPLPIHL